MDRETAEKYIETIRKAAKSISEITGWEWYENICTPEDEWCTICYHDGWVFKEKHKGGYFVFFIPRGIRWFKGIIWLGRGEKWGKIIALSDEVFEVPDQVPPDDYELYDVWDEVWPRIKEGQRIVRRWVREASKKFKVRIKVDTGTEYGQPELRFEFTPRSFSSEKIKQAFKAMKYAYEGAVQELEKRKMVILDKEGRWITL